MFILSEEDIIKLTKRGICMGYVVRQTGSKAGESEEVIKLPNEFTQINVETPSSQTFAVVICMTCESHRNRIKHRLIVPNVDSHLEAIGKAKLKYKLSGEWCTEIGVTLFKTNTDFVLPTDWEECEQQFQKG